MSKTTITYIVIAVCAVGGVAAFGSLIVAPAWSAYTKTWQRLAATFLSLYVLAGLVVLGAGLGVVVVYFWDRVF
jgi:hypothetical protein